VTLEVIPGRGKGEGHVSGRDALMFCCVGAAY